MLSEADKNTIKEFRFEDTSGYLTGSVKLLPDLVGGSLLIAVICFIFDKQVWGIIAIVVMVIFIMTLLFGVFIPFHKYKRRRKQTIEKYGEDKLYQHIQENAVDVFVTYRNQLDVIFTDKMVVTAYDIFTYDEIESIRTNSTQFGRRLEFKLADGPVISTCDEINQEEYEHIKELLLKYNPEIIAE